MLAERAATHTALDNLYGVAMLLDGLQEVEAHEQVAVLAERAATHTALDNPYAVIMLLDGLRQVGVHEQVIVLADTGCHPPPSITRPPWPGC